MSIVEPTITYEGPRFRAFFWSPVESDVAWRRGNWQWHVLNGCPYAVALFAGALPADPQISCCATTTGAALLGALEDAVQ